MIFLDFMKVKKFMKICSKTHQIALLKFSFGEACPRTPLAKAWLCPASQAPPQKKKNNSKYWEIYLRIHPGRQLIVCRTLYMVYVYALQNLFRGQKMTKIVAQHILKCITLLDGRGPNSPSSVRYSWMWFKFPCLTSVCSRTNCTTFSWVIICLCHGEFLWPVPHTPLTSWCECTFDIQSLLMQLSKG